MNQTEANEKATALTSGIFSISLFSAVVGAVLTEIAGLATFAILFVLLYWDWKRRTKENETGDTTDHNKGYQ
jgi:hypothetical protein